MDCSDQRLDRTVAVAAGFHGYPIGTPFSPAIPYSEYPFARGTVAQTTNAAYGGVRQALCLLGLDAEHADTPDWNPLSVVVRPGDTVVLKPNFVREFRESSPDHADCVITHGSVIRAVLDYVFIALRGRGRIVIADAPQNDADFEVIRRIAGLDGIRAFYREHAGMDVEVYDLRPERAHKIDGVIVGHEVLAGDPAGYVPVNLGAHSTFAPIEHRCNRLYGAEYDTAEVCTHHRGGVHEYLISKTVLDADVVISLPKLKTHKKVGITVNLKNLVGINGDKNWLPHHREGTPSQGGDEFADDAWMHRVERAMVARFKRYFPSLGSLRPVLAAPAKFLGKRLFGDTNRNTIRSGNWYGNDTAWRMVLDLNRILCYADSCGMLHDRPVRRFFSVVDGIIGGEGNGPLDPTPRAAGIVLAGGHPASVDLVAARLMGFDPRCLPLLAHAFEADRLGLFASHDKEVQVRSNDGGFAGAVGAIASLVPPFVPHFGWKGHLELNGARLPEAAMLCAG